MADSKAVGCWGVLVGLMAGAVLLWLTIDLLAVFFGALTGGGIGGLLVDPGFHHQLGQLLVIGALVVGVFVAVFRPDIAGAFSTQSRAVFWFGAALNLLAWLRVADGVRWSTWSLVLVLIGAAGPFFVRAIARSNSGS